MLDYEKYINRIKDLCNMKFSYSYFEREVTKGINIDTLSNKELEKLQYEASRRFHNAEKKFKKVYKKIEEDIMVEIIKENGTGHSSIDLAVYKKAQCINNLEMKQLEENFKKLIGRYKDEHSVYMD